jgi:hypothetical protein
VTSRFIAILAWLTAGHALLVGLFWRLLVTPESNVAMLTASALTAMLLTLVFGWIEAAGLLAWRTEALPWRLAGRAFRAAPGVWLGAALFVLVWYLVSDAGAWWAHHQGETDAWLMLHFGKANTTIVHQGFRVLLAVLQLFGLSLALSLASAVVGDGYRAIGSARWLRRGVSPRQLVLLAAVLFVFVWLPWQGVNWRPSWLKPNWQETLFVTAKLGVIYLLANLGWTLAIGTAARQR